MNLNNDLPLRVRYPELFIQKMRTPAGKMKAPQIMKIFTRTRLSPEKFLRLVTEELQEMVLRDGQRCTIHSNKRKSEFLTLTILLQ